MIIVRALQLLPRLPSSASHRRFSRVSVPTPTSMVEVTNIPVDSVDNGEPENSSSDSLPPPFKELQGNTQGEYGPGLLALLDRDSRGYGFGKDYQCGYKTDMGGRPGYADDCPDDRFHSGASPGKVSEPYDFVGTHGDHPDAGNIQRYSSSPGILRRYSSNGGNIESIGLDYILKSELIASHFRGYYLHENTYIGERLVEVFSICVHDYENLGYLYGTIQFEGDDGRVLLYKRQPSDSELVSQDGTLSLTGPLYSLRATEHFHFILKLKDKDGNPFPIEDAPIVCLDFDCFDLLDKELLDKRMKRYCHGNSASIGIYFTVFYNAVQAKVDVDVVKGEGVHEVYGRIVARYSNYDYSTDEQKKYFQNVLFDKSANNYVDLEPEMHIPLSRYGVAVPTTSFLIIEANLWNYGELKPDDQIAKGTVMFKPQTEGQTIKSILGVSGRVRVTVTWSVAVCQFLGPC